jgi:hypothetical protein
MKRWHATIIYRSDSGPVDVEHDFEELAELHNLVERGPNWNAIERITVRLQRKSESAGFTIEQKVGGGRT